MSLGYTAEGIHHKHGECTSIALLALCQPQSRPTQGDLSVRLDASLLWDMLSNDWVDEITPALQAARPPVLRGNVPAAAGKGLNWPLQPLEANNGPRSSGLLRRMDDFVPFAASSRAASAARADAGPLNEGWSTIDARLLHLEQAIARLVNAADRK